jgi:phosphate:Na+ symporter
LVFDNDTPFEKSLKKKFTLDDLYENIKLLHAEIFTYYSKIQNQKLNESEAKELERLIYASRNIMNALKNFKGIRHNMEQYQSLLTTFVQIEEADNLFINNISEAISEGNIHEAEIASLLLVNRLFTQSCRMQIYCLKDILLSLEQINNFDRAMDMKEIMNAGKVKYQANPE